MKKRENEGKTIFRRLCVPRTVFCLCFPCSAITARVLFVSVRVNESACIGVGEYLCEMLCLVHSCE